MSRKQAHFLTGGLMMPNLSAVCALSSQVDAVASWCVSESPQHFHSSFTQSQYLREMLHFTSPFTAAAVFFFCSTFHFWHEHMISCHPSQFWAGGCFSASVSRWPWTTSKEESFGHDMFWGIWVRTASSGPRTKTHSGFSRSVQHRAQHHSPASTSKVSLARVYFTSSHHWFSSRVHQGLINVRPEETRVGVPLHQLIDNLLGFIEAHCGGRMNVPPDQLSRLVIDVDLESEDT